MEFTHIAFGLVGDVLLHSLTLAQVKAACDRMKRAVTSSKRMDFSLSLNVFGNLRNNVSTQLNKMYNKGVVLFWDILLWKCYVAYYISFFLSIF